MSYTLGEAAKATGKSKPTISRAIKSGKISALKNDNGQYEIEPSELHRIYPALQSDSNDSKQMKQSVTPDETPLLQQKIEHLNELLKRAEEDRDEWKDQAKILTKSNSLLLEDKTNKKGFLSRLFG